jgi:hypothetical protein
MRGQDTLHCSEGMKNSASELLLAMKQFRRQETEHDIKHHNLLKKRTAHAYSCGQIC